MNFNNPKVRQRMIEHITFAISSVTAAIPDSEISAFTEGTMIGHLTDGLRNPIIVTVLSYTLALDNNLRNSMRWNEGDIVDTGPGTPKEPIDPKVLL